MKSKFLGPIIGVFVSLISLLIFLLWDTTHELIFGITVSNIVLWAFLILTFIIALIYTVVYEVKHFNKED